MIPYLEDVVEHDDGLAAARPGVVVAGLTAVLPGDLPEPLDLRGAEADDLARQRRRPRRGGAGVRRRDVGPARAQDARCDDALCKDKVSSIRSQFIFRVRLGTHSGERSGANMISKLICPWGGKGARRSAPSILV